MSEKMKAAALSAAKGLSRVQAERAAANATRNVNAYGQKEEGPSRWQEKKEAKTQMYLKSTEKQPTLNQKRCQKCRQTGHWTYECQKPASEAAKPESVSPFSHDLGGVFIKKDEKAEKSLKKKTEKHSKHKNKKRKHRSRSTSESSDSESDDDRRRKRKKHSRRSKQVISYLKLIFTWHTIYAKA
ncbi:hypothetical protein QVD17_02124 [Tagetes erecta]|uniref:Zinc finger CCHC domain-containing protein 10 n=1 Tax=Tagetes erecta TaxID=13708 RepID=A0AAD8LEY5_TARER|nr:hypothetical protein QVD17_02124 [Tagetes erecta]